MSQMPMAPDVNDNDKLMAALAYFLPVLMPAIILLVESMKVRPYQKYHAIQSLGLAVAALFYSVVVCVLLAICGGIVSVMTLGFGSILIGCLGILFFVPAIPNIYYAIIAYTRLQYFEIPVVTKFMMQQGWLTQP